MALQDGVWSLKGRRLLAIDGCLTWKCIRRLLESPFILVSMESCIDHKVQALCIGIGMICAFLDQMAYLRRAREP
jgi:hypothetical protein